MTYQEYLKHIQELKETVEENFYNLCEIKDDDYKKHIKAIKKFDNLISNFKDDLEDLLKEVKE